MRGGLSRKELEHIRLETGERLSAGDVAVEEAAREVGVDKRTIYRWMAAYRSGGEEALAAKQHPGRPRRLSARDLRRLEGYLLKGATGCGFPNELWTCRRVAEMIHDRFGVSYHRRHVPRILSRLGWTPQKPERHAKERDEAAIETWVKRDWPRIQKKPAVRGRRSSSPMRQG